MFKIRTGSLKSDILYTLCNEEGISGPVRLSTAVYRLPGPDVFINFQSDSKGQGAGFKAAYEIITSDGMNATGEGMKMILFAWRDRAAGNILAEAVDKHELNLFKCAQTNTLALESPTLDQFSLPRCLIHYLFLVVLSFYRMPCTNPMRTNSPVAPFTNMV